MQPNTPMIKPGLDLFICLNSVSLFLTLSSAFSLMEQVFIKIRSALFSSEVAPKPFACKMEATTSLSAKFMAQP